MNKENKMSEYDVVVIGAGPAGTLSALKCSESDLNVLLVERGQIDRHKPCGGILPKVCTSLISESLGTDIPEDIMCPPNPLGLYYVPPSGRKNSGNLKNYELINVYRDQFDRWLHQLATEAGVHIWYETEFLKLQGSKPIQIILKNQDKIISITASYVIGADGVYSKVRNQIYGKTRVNVEPILQEYWQAEGDFENCFYIFFRGEISPTCAYLIPKENLYVLGVGAPEPNTSKLPLYITRFKKWLQEEFAFQPVSLKRREVWPIPYGSVFKGIGNTILIGDAAGFCNTLSGEGIRFALESGIAAHDAIMKTISIKKSLATVYSENVEELIHFLHSVHQFGINLTDESREEFVRSELDRFSITE
jgi:flavin-dependent dehydrogenase